MSISRPLPKTLLDGFFFQLAHTGIARVWTSLLREWVASGCVEQVLVLDRGDTAPRIDGVRYRSIPLYDYRTSGADAAHLQALCDEEQAELFVSTYYTAPLTTPSVFVAYDMIPEVYAHELTSPMWREKHYGLQHASAHVAISHSTAQDLAKFFPEIERSAVTVAYPGVEASFHPADAGEVAGFRARHGLDKPYFLLVGSRAGFNGYKNALLFFQGFAALPERERFAVVCVGGEAKLEADFEPYLGDTELHLVQLNDDDLRAAYSGAVALAYPSRYEGFGLPVLEALACGCPVLTCRNSSLVEVAGDAALFVPETDAAAMTAALQRVQDAAVRSELRAAGLQQAAKFSWRGMAETLVSVFRSAAPQARPPQRLWTEFRRLQAVAQERDFIEQQLRLSQQAALEQYHKAVKLEMEVSEANRLLNEANRGLALTNNLLAEIYASNSWKLCRAMVDSKNKVAGFADRWLPRRAS